MACPSNGHGVFVSVAAGDTPGVVVLGGRGGSHIVPFILKLPPKEDPSHAGLARGAGPEASGSAVAASSSGRASGCQEPRRHAAAASLRHMISGSQLRGQPGRARAGLGPVSRLLASGELDKLK